MRNINNKPSSSVRNKTDGGHGVDYSNLRASLKAKANYIRKSYFKVQGMTKDHEKSSLVLPKQNYDTMEPSQSTKRIFDANRDDVMDNWQTKQKIFNTSNFLDMFTNISKEIKEGQMMKKKKNKQTINPFENSFVVDKMGKPQGKCGWYGKISNHTLKDISFRPQRTSQVFIKSLNKVDHKSLAPKIRKGSNFSRKPQSSETNPEIRTNKMKVKTEGHQRLQESEIFRPLGEIFNGPNYQSTIMNERRMDRIEKSIQEDGNSMSIPLKPQKLNRTQQQNIKKGNDTSSPQGQSRNPSTFHQKVSKLNTRQSRFRDRGKRGQQKLYKSGAIISKNTGIILSKNKPKAASKKIKSGFIKTVNQSPQKTLYEGLHNHSRQFTDEDERGQSFGPWIQSKN